MLTVAAHRAKESLAELVNKSESSQELVIVNRGEPLARLEASSSGHDVEHALSVAERILKTAKRIGRNNITHDEIEAWVDEGRP